MKPTVIDNPSASRFEILVEDRVVGYAEYRRDGATVALTHTSIDPEFEGRGLGSTLARHALTAIRDQGASVLPFCPFIRGYIQRHPEYLQLVPPDARGRFRLTSPATEQDSRGH
ncbi:MAG TPA: GNAT family N-acetyltransferase [Natronosporangium sp.]|nr:GNAT family N-acetyltransferase [Natronosporangium sp.]